MPNDLLAELAQIEHIDGVKQANDDELAPIDGLDLYAGNDDTLRATLDLGGAGGILVASHVVGDEMRRMVDEPDEPRARSTPSLRDVYEALSVTANPIAVKAALNLLGHRVGGLRLPLVEADEDERPRVRAMLERHGLLAGRRARERHAARPPARRAGRDRQEHDGRRVRRPHRRRRRRAALPDRRA